MVRKLIYNSSEVSNLQLNMESIQSAINNKIELITNDSIKLGLLIYPRLYDDYKVQENLMKALKHERIRPKIQEYISLENIVGRSDNFSSDIRGLLSDRTLANYMTDRKWESGEWKRDFLVLRKHNEALKGLLKRELNVNEE
jgi:hypothetical protein